MFTIQTFPFNDSGRVAASRIDKWCDWPVIYLMNNDTDIYIGGTTCFERSFVNHLNDKKAYSEFTEISFVCDGTENESVINDYKFNLIRLFTADGRFQHVLSDNLNQDNGHSYNERRLYQTKIQLLWNQLYGLGLAQNSYQTVKNKSTYKLSPYIHLTAEQRDVVRLILYDFLDSLESGKKGGAIINGGAGTGKSLLAVKIIDILSSVSSYLADWKCYSGAYGKDWCDLMSRLEEFIRTYGQLRLAYIAPQQSFNTDMQRVFGTMLPKVGRDIVHNTSSIVTRYPLQDDLFDLVLVDEAHRLKHRIGMGNDIGLFDENCRRLGLSDNATQLDVILARTKYCCMFYDSNQTVKISDITPAEIERSVNVLNHAPLRLSLNVQMRCLGGGNYEQFIDDVLSGNAEPRIFRNYDFRVYDNVYSMVNDIRELNKDYGLCRNLAGFSWPWKTKSFLKDNSSLLASMGGINHGKNATNLLKLGQYDILIGQSRFVWNIKSKGWITSIGAEEEIGCIHTSQGYDLNYCGLILGPDIIYNPQSHKIEIDESCFCDPFYKQKAKRISPEEIHRYIINSYRTMLLRGICGCFVYAVDDNLRLFLKQCESFVKSSVKDIRIPDIELEEKNSETNFANITDIKPSPEQNPDKWFGCRITSLRKKKGLSQEELAFKSGINRSYMGVIERGEKSPSIETISKVAKGLGVSICELFHLI